MIASMRDLYLHLFSGVVIFCTTPWAVALDTVRVRSKRVWVIPIIFKIGRKSQMKRE